VKFDDSDCVARPVITLHTTSNLYLTAGYINPFCIITHLKLIRILWEQDAINNATKNNNYHYLLSESIELRFYIPLNTK